MNAKFKVIVLPKRDFNIKLRLVSDDNWWKKLVFFWALAWEKTQPRLDLPPVPSRILCSSLLFFDDLFSVCFQKRLCISFSRCSSLDIRLFTFCLLLLSFAFLTLYSAWIGVLSNFLARFPRLTLRLLLLTFFGRSVSFFSAYFQSKPSLHELEW